MLVQNIHVVMSKWLQFKKKKLLSLPLESFDFKNSEESVSTFLFHQPRWRFGPEIKFSNQNIKNKSAGSG